MWSTRSTSPAPSRWPTPRWVASGNWIDTDLADRAFLVGDRFSATDAYLWMLGRWSRHQANPAFARPNIRRFWDQMLERPSLLRVIEQEELAWVP